MASQRLVAPKLTLLTLPPEIRNQIFDLAVVEIDPLPATVCDYGWPSRAGPLPPALARVCRKARDEAVPIFYGANTFTFDHPTLALTWHDLLSKFVKGAAGYVTKIVLQDYYCFGPDRTVCSQHRDVEMRLVLDVSHPISVCYSGNMEDTCTCEIEAAAREMSQASNWSCDNPLVLFAAWLGTGEYAMEQCYGGKKPTESCGCGKACNGAK